MIDENYVRMEKHACIVCGCKYDTGAILMHTQLRAIPEKNATTGTGICPEHKKLADEGYIALVEADERRSTVLANGNVAPEKAYRLGGIVHIKRDAWENIFDSPAPDVPMVFINTEVYEKLVEIQEGVECPSNSSPSS